MIYTFPVREHHCPLAGTILYCLVTQAHMCEQLVHRKINILSINYVHFATTNVKPFSKVIYSILNLRNAQETAELKRRTGQENNDDNTANKQHRTGNSS